MPMLGSESPRLLQERTVPVRSLVRPRLLRRVAAMGPGLTLVVGPAGSGRSTLLAQLDDAAAGEGIACVRLRALETGLHWLSAEGERVCSFADAVDDLHDLTGPTLVTIDDGDLLSSHPGHEEQFERLVRLLPDQVGVVVAATIIPPSLLARAGRNVAGVIPAAELAFRSYEVDELFRAVHRAPLGAHDVHLLTRMTDGWAASLELFHASVAGLLPGDRSRAVRALGNEPWFLAEYAEQVLLADCTSQDRTILGRGSAFEHMTPARLVAIGSCLDGGIDPAAALARLERMHQLPAAQTPSGLRLPGPLRRYLRAMHARDLGHVEARAWLAAAGAVLAADDDVAGALECYGRAGDAAAVARLTIAPSSQLWDGARAVEPWDAVCPTAPAQARAFARLSRALGDGAQSLADGLLDEVGALAGNALEYDEYGSARLGRLRDSLRAWAGPRSVTVAAEGEVEWRTQLRWALQGGSAVPRPSRPAELFVSGLVHGLTHEVERGRDEMRRVVEDPGVGRGFALLATLSALLLDPAIAPEQVFDTADRVLAEANGLGLTWTERLAHTVVLGVEGRPGWREPVGRLRHWGQEAGDSWGPLVLTTVAELCAMRRDEDDSQRWLELAAGWQERGLPLVAEACRLAAVHPGEESSAEPEMEPGADKDPVSGAAWPPGARAPREATPAHERGARIQCLGPFELWVDGRKVDLGQLRPRARTLLRLLAMEAGHVVHRERLVDALWPDLSPESATHNLHVSVSAVRRVLNQAQPGFGRQLLQREGESYVLRLADGIHCDLVDLEAALRSGEYAASRDDDQRARRAWGRALELFDDDLLPDAGSAEWVLGPRDRLRQQVAGAATSLAVLLLRAGEHVAASEAAARAIEFDHSRDHAWRVLIEALTLAGDHASAQRTRTSYRAMLRSLGVEEPAGPAVRDRARIDASWGEGLPGPGSDALQ